jgi:hypothetical protein
MAVETAVPLSFFNYSFIVWNIVIRNQLII